MHVLRQFSGHFHHKSVPNVGIPFENKIVFQITTWKRARRRSSVLPCLNGTWNGIQSCPRKVCGLPAAHISLTQSHGGIPLNQVLYAIFVDMQSLPGALYPEHQCRHREPQPEVEDHAQKPQRNIEHAAHETAGRIHCTALLMYCLFINKKLVLGNSLLFCN